jgi:hypothetical protein
MRSYHSRWKFRYLEIEKRRRNQNRCWGGRSGARLEYEGVDAADLLGSALIIRSFINWFAVVMVRRDVRMNQWSVMVVMRVRGGVRRVQMRVRQHHQTKEDCENGGPRSQSTHHLFYRSASFPDCQAAAGRQL